MPKPLIVNIPKPVRPEQFARAECARCGEPFNDTARDKRRHQLLFGHLPGRYRRPAADLSQWLFGTLSKKDMRDRRDPDRCRRTSAQREPGALRKAVLERMQQGGSTQRKIADDLDVSERTVNTTVVRLRQAGLLPAPAPR